MTNMRWLLVVMIGFNLLAGRSLVSAAEFDLDQVEISTDKQIYDVNEPILVWVTYINPQERQWLWLNTPLVRRFDATALFNPVEQANTRPPLAAIGLDPVYNLGSDTEGSVQVDSNSKTVVAQRTNSSGLPAPGLYLIQLNFSVRDAADPRASNSLLVAQPSTLIEVRGASESSKSPTITVAPNTVPVGGTVNVTWSGVKDPTTTDWISLNTSNSSDVGDLSLIYTSSCAPTSGETAKASGSCDVEIPEGIQPKSYHFRLFSPNAKPKKVAASNLLTVTPIQ